MLMCKLAPWRDLLADAAEAIFFLFANNKNVDKLWEQTVAERRLAAMEAASDSLEPNQLKSHTGTPVQGT